MLESLITISCVGCAVIDLLVCFIAVHGATKLPAVPLDEVSCD
jgi:hypothetical protein